MNPIRFVLSGVLTERKPSVIPAVVEKKTRHIANKRKTPVAVVPEKSPESVDPVAVSQPSARDASQPSTPTTKRRQTKSKKTTQKLICTVCFKTAGAGTYQCYGCAGWVHFRCSNGGYKNYNTSFRCAPCLAVTVPAPSSD
ncbi:hypothetical protein L3Y34_015086 [Caenorhabditis briggsae]|uniref:Zinc finger PHD-type domain-containing protein n=1 Tax=Caenorhabditis briggsae TaxID=6238 RepID=A0AAE9DU54_CAEBR|nr:hypothetical protein L3Y34_015086 [Caenorhabditis briggsae]